MKNTRTWGLTAAACLALTIAIPTDGAEPEGFDAEMAAALGADDYGMRPYVMAFLKSGPNPSEDAERARELQAAHLANIRRMAEAGQLVLAGPFMDGGDVRGIYLFATDDIEQAREWTRTDPAIEAGALAMELRPWYGSAAILKVNELHARIAKENP